MSSPLSVCSYASTLAQLIFCDVPDEGCLRILRVEEVFLVS